jgi:hypothetical protein
MQKLFSTTNNNNNKKVNHFRRKKCENTLNNCIQTDNFSSSNFPTHPSEINVTIFYYLAVQTETFQTVKHKKPLSYSNFIPNGTFQKFLATRKIHIFLCVYFSGRFFRHQIFFSWNLKFLIFFHQWYSIS